jgi:hypothetical protein
VLCVAISVTRIVGDAGRDEKGQSTGTKEIDSYNIDARQQQPTASQFLTLLCKLQLLVMCLNVGLFYIFRRPLLLFRLFFGAGLCRSLSAYSVL